MAKITDAQIKTFLDEIESVSKKHGLSISHEDGHGAFMIEPFSQDNIDWLKEARINYLDEYTPPKDHTKDLINEDTGSRLFSRE